jgi:hypothetical protein
MAQDLEALLERRKKLQEQLDEVEAKVVELKQAQIQEHLAALKELGYQTRSRAKRGSSSASRHQDPNKKCPICEIPGHDARAHRSQGEKKKPFTKEELKERGLANT